jgi:ABC-type hemin transport system substrate-binding protein
MHQFPPRRIICLTEETVETLYLLGEQDRIVGVSGYAVRPPQVRREKPRIVEIKSALILQRGPAALTDGLDAMVAALWPVG